MDGIAVDRNIRERAESIPLQDRAVKVASVKPESELHRVLQQLLERMGATWVEVRQGQDEFGKDLLACFPSQFGTPDHVAIVAKLGKVSGRVDNTSSLAVVLRQLDQAFTVPAATEKASSPVRVTMAIVVCTGEFSGNARTQIAAEAERSSRRVQYWDARELVGRLTKYLPEFFFDVDKDERDYLVALQHRMGDLSDDMRRYGKSLSFTLDEVFIDPRVAVLEAVPSLRGARKRRGKTGLIPLPAANLDIGGISRILSRDDSLLVLGPAGSGKTTLLRKAAHEMCHQRMISGNRSAAPLPIWLSARKLSAVDDEPDFLELLNRCYGDHASAPPIALVRAAFESAGLAVFVDDMDLVPPGDPRRRTRRWLEILATAHRKVRVIAATRMSLFESPTFLTDYKPTFLFPFRMTEIRALLERILGRERAYRVLDSFLQQDRTGGLPHTPLVVTLLAILHRTEVSGEVPANIAELYRMVSEVYLGKWAENVGDAGLERYALLLSWHFMLRSLHSAWQGAAGRRIVPIQIGVFAGGSVEPAWQALDRGGMPRQ